MDFYTIAPGLIIGLGVLGVVAVILIFLSCRCFPALQFTKRWTGSEKYQKFFRTHCQIWWIFLIIMVLHIIIASLYFLTPF